MSYQDQPDEPDLTGETYSPPMDSHVHTQWSWDAPAEASMVRSCEQALAAGLPAVAFTDHLDFTVASSEDVIAVEHIDPRPYSAMRLLDVPGYLASVQDCRERFPDLRILTGAEIGEAQLCAASRVRPHPRLVARDPVRRQAARVRRAVPADARR